jgi:hypothetical protein
VVAAVNTACSDPEHALSHDEEMRATLKIPHIKKIKNVYMKCKLSQTATLPQNGFCEGGGGDLPH